MFIIPGWWVSMAKGLEFKELSNYLEQLTKLSKKTADGIMKQVLYEGAKVYADELREAAAPHGNLADGIALSQMKEDSGWYTRLGFYGYDTDGKAYAMKAAVIAYGTSKGRDATDKNFIRRAYKRADQKAQAAMESKMQELITDIMEVK